MRRRVVLSVVLVPVALVVIGLATLPWWLGAALGWAGVEFARYERLGDGRFALHAVEIEREALTARVARLEADTPLVWLWGRVSGRGPGAVIGGEWSVAVREPATKPEPVPASGVSDFSWLELESTRARLTELLGDWLPEARLASGVVTWPGGEVAVGPATWRDGRLEIAHVVWGERISASVAAEFSAEQWRVEARDTARELTLAATVRGTEVTATGTVWGQPWLGSARFASTGWRPEVAAWTAEDWLVSGARLGVGEVYSQVTGGARARWAEGGFAFTVEAAGAPVDDAPALRLALAGRGDEREVTLERLEARAPGLTATLDQPVRMTFGGELLSGASRFALSADLAQWPGSEATGRASGWLTVEPTAGGVPELRAALTAMEVAVAGWRVDAVSAEASLEWPQVIVPSAEVVLPGGERLAVSGRWNIPGRILNDGRLEGRLTSATYGRWLPEGVSLESVEVAAQAQGAWPQVTHRGTLAAGGLGTDWTRPAEVFVEWSGREREVERVVVDATAGEAALRVVGAVGAAAATVSELVVSEADAERLRLVQPARVVWSPEVGIEGLRLEGPAGRVAADGGAAELSWSVEALATAWLRAWLVWPGPDWSVERLAGRASWAAGPLDFSVEGRAEIALSAERSARVTLRAGGGPEGVLVETLRVSAEGQPVVRAEGRLPVVIYPGAERAMVWLADGELGLQARTEPSALFWGRLAELTGVVIVDPALDVAVSGTWAKPRGRAELSVARIAADAERWPQALPEIEGLRATLRGDGDGMELEGVSLRLAGQEIIAEGRLPVSPDEWPGLVREPARLASAGGSLRIQIPDAEVAALARFLPQYLAPTGRLRLEVALREDGGWDGTLRLDDAASRPLGPLGVLSEVNADLRLAGRAMELRTVSAMMGGRPVTLTGAVDLSDWRNPAPDVRLRGDNLPLVRSSGVLVRTDLDLRVRTDAAGRVGITGETVLRDSLLLADLRSLLPKGGRGGPMRRPPYFSVDTPPLNGWTLDVALRGERFMKLRTPLFNGVMTARFRLLGTLGEPRLVGEALVDEGRVRLPFATFEVEQGTVRISEASPGELRLDLTATARRYGYLLRMELGGTAASPELVFGASPSLTSEQVLLLVMTGQTPSDEVTVTSRQRAVRLGTYLGRSLLGTFGLAPEESDRLTITIGEKISRQGRETYDVGYALTPRWTLTGEYTEFDEYNVGLKWRFYTSKPEVGEDDE